MHNPSIHSTSEKQSHPKSHNTIFLVSMIAALAGLLFGFDTGIISGALLFIKSSFAVTTTMKEMLVGSVLVGAILGSVSSGKLADRYGRRGIILVISFLFIIGTAIASLAPTIDIILLGRFFIGIAIGIGSYTAPLYIAEAAPFEKRGGLISLNQLMITLGILISYCINYVFANTHESWRWMFAIGIIPAVLLAIGMIFLPESPRWLVMKNRLTQARETLQYLRAKTDVEHEINEIKTSLQMKEAKFGSLFAPWLRSVLLIGLFLGFLQQAVGINSIIYYAPTIFKMAGFHSATSSILATIGVGVINVIATIFAIRYIDTLGRRPLFFAGLIGMGISLCFLSYAFHNNAASEALQRMAVGGALFYIICFAFSLGPLLWILVAEIYPLEIRGVAMSFTVASSWFCNLLISSTFLTLLDKIGPSHTFLLYAIVCVVGLIFCYLWIPETKGVSLEMIENNIRAGLPVREIGQPSSKGRVDVDTIQLKCFYQSRGRARP